MRGGVGLGLLAVTGDSPNSGPAAHASAMLQGSPGCQGIPGFRVCMRLVISACLGSSLVGSDLENFQPLGRCWFLRRLRFSLVGGKVGGRYIPYSCHTNSAFRLVVRSFSTGRLKKNETGQRVEG